MAVQDGDRVTFAINKSEGKKKDELRILKPDLPSLTHAATYYQYVSSVFEQRNFKEQKRPTLTIYWRFRLRPVMAK